ncbi:MAG: hypothetical protein BWY21_01883 [Parcubacteria group bacterium ADurb.Bin216]|nr:MAG: hypothetical protein BWY21_01883 [Parcubacteria group bacterium ADurb.Bin216]
MAKERFDYTQIGLAKVEDVTTFDGKRADELNLDAKAFLINYGAFVAMSRTLAGHEKDTIAEKRALVEDYWNWLEAGCPKRERKVSDAFTTACNKIMTSEGNEKDKLAAIKALENAFGKTYSK